MSTRGMAKRNNVKTFHVFLVVLASACGILCLKVAKAPEDQLNLALRDATQSLLNAVSQHNGWDHNDVKIGKVDVRDALVGQGLSYDFVVRAADVSTSFSISEDVTRWEFLNDIEDQESAARTSSLLGGSQDEESNEKSETKDGSKQEQQGSAAVDVWKGKLRTAALPAFDLEGPLELWIEDTQQLRLAMPHDVDAGEVKKVVLAEGAMVAVHGAQGVALARPLQLPLPLLRAAEADALSGKAAAAGIVALARRLKAAALSQSIAGGRALIALRIIKPTVLVAVSPDSSGALAASSLAPPDALPSAATGVVASGRARLKVKRISAGAVELRSAPSTALVEREKKGSLETWAQEKHRKQDDQAAWSWPFLNLNSSDTRVVGLEKALVAVLAKKAYKKGYFQVISAQVAPTHLVKAGFEVELRPNKSQIPRIPGASEEGAGEVMERQIWELTARVLPRGKLQPVRLHQVGPVASSVMLSWNDGTLNGTLAGDASAQTMQHLNLEIEGQL